MQASLTVKAATDVDVFRAFGQHMLGPTLRPGQMVVMDNLSAHKQRKVRRLLAARQCRLVLAALLARFQSDGVGLEQAENLSAGHPGTAPTGAGTGRRHRAEHDYRSGSAELSFVIAALPYNRRKFALAPHCGNLLTTR